MTARAGLGRTGWGQGVSAGDYDNDGDVDVLINPVNAVPQLLRADTGGAHHWLKVKAVGVRSNRSGVGARVRVVTADGAQIDEVRSGGGYYSQNDLRLHFGLGRRRRAEAVEIRWPSGHVDTLRHVAADRIIVVKEGVGLVRPGGN